ncbi:MAG: hypothetical protein J6S67_15295 [Methanobrevibacter sp.]|nr:hypothetical protein [Methanobrevibacter sp.]
MTLQSIIQKKSRLQTVSRQELMQESVISEVMVPAYLNYKIIKKLNCDVAKTLCARDYKGFGTGWDTMNGVVEWT